MPDPSSIQRERCVDSACDEQGNLPKLELKAEPCAHNALPDTQVATAHIVLNMPVSMSALSGDRVVMVSLVAIDNMQCSISIWWVAIKLPTAAMTPLRHNVIKRASNVWYHCTRNAQ